MKKIYVTPNTNLVEVKMENLLQQYSNAPAAKNATVLSREGDSSFWDDED